MLGSARVLHGGDVFGNHITIRHSPRNVDSLQILEVFFSYPEEYLIPSNQFSVVFGNGNIETFGKYCNDVILLPLHGGGKMSHCNGMVL
jgi:hypothetical protein